MFLWSKCDAEPTQMWPLQERRTSGAITDTDGVGCRGVRWRQNNTLLLPSVQALRADSGGGTLEAMSDSG